MTGKKVLIYGFLSGMIILSASACFAAGTPVTDPERDAKGVLQQAESLADKAQQEIIKAEEKKSEVAEHGNANCSANPQNTKENGAIKTEVFEYLYDEVLDSGFEDEADEIIKPAETYAENLKKVKETFFAQPNEDSGLTELGEKVNQVTSGIGLDMSKAGLSTEEIKKIREIREEYASQVAAKNLKISLDLREKMAEDFESIQKTQTAGCNQLQGLMMDNRNLVALIKETSSDIMVQILTLESMGAKMLLKEDAELLSVPKKVSDEEEKS